jgi:hypothetical protein
MAFIGTPAFADLVPTDSEWILQPNGEYDVTGLDQISFDLIYDNADAAFQAFAWDITLWLDIEELTPYSIADEFDVDFVYEDTFGASFGSLFADGGALDGDEFRIAGGSFDDVWIDAGQHTMATVTFDILDPDFFNGTTEADVYVMANDETDGQGFNSPDDNLYYIDAPSTQNPDIGLSATAVPAIDSQVSIAAVCLLALLGIVDMQRRNTKTPL